MIPSEEEILAFIEESFQENFEQIRYTSGHSLSPDVKETARRQVLLYWARLREVALTVTDTEVKLNLAGQHTPGGREFGIEGVVDIVRGQEQTVMYDIKTQDREGVLAYKDSYERQLNVYAYIWQKLRGELLDKIAIIATQFPRPVEEAWKNGDADQLAQALADWEPLVDIDLNPAHLQQMIAAFAMTVDQIEDSRFSAPELRWLERRDVHDQTFATRVCRNCDGRFSCRSYREYAVTEGRRHPDKYQRYYEDFGEEDALEDWRTAALGAGAG